MADEPVVEGEDAEPKEPAEDPSIGGPDHAPEGEDDSLAAHEAAYGEKKDAPKEPIVPRILKRHRAQKDVASKADVPRIQELTRKLRDTEAELAKARGGSATPDKQFIPPVAKTAAGAAAVPPVAKTAAAVAGLRAKPSEDEVGTKYASYADFVEDLSDWKDEAREATRVQARAEEDTKAQQAKQLERAQTAHKNYTKRAAAYTKEHPEFPGKVAKLGALKLGPLAQALMDLDNGPELVDTLVSTPYLAIEASNFWGEKPTSEEFVALATQWLTSRVQPGSTGAGAAASTESQAPTPLTPVRTGLMTPGDRLPGDDASIADHERAFYPAGSRGRRR